MLPKIPYENGAARVPIMQYGGLDRRVGAGNGAITDMTNLTGNDVPVLSSRAKRKQTATLTNPRGIFAVGGRLFHVENNKLYRDNLVDLNALPGTANTERYFAAMGNRLLIWPDKILTDITTTGSYTALAASVTQLCTFGDGTYAGEAAEGNTIYGPSGYDWSNLFKVGDGVTITGAADTENNKTAIVREISGNELRFYENTFTVNSTAASITVARMIPDLDYICVNDNRVWGCKDDTIWCSKLGDPENWNVFDGISTDAWSVETGTPGAFTGCISFMGYPIFFKEDRVFKVYGNKPTNFEVMSSATLGVLPGADKTLAVAGETLFYLSRAGFVRYNGGYPSRVDVALNAKYTTGAAGSDGRKYFVSALRDDNVREFLVFDPETGLWHKEDDFAVKGFAHVGNAVYAQSATANTIVSGASSPTEASVESSVTFGDIDSVTINRSTYTFSSKYPVRLWVRYEMEAKNVTENGVTTDTARLRVDTAYNGGTFAEVAALPSTNKTTQYLALPIKRCDRFQIRFRANSAWKLHGMEIETRTERTNRKGG